jgi:hypothetical protein
MMNKVKKTLLTLGIAGIAATSMSTAQAQGKADASLNRIELQKKIKAHGITKKSYDYITKAIAEAEAKADSAATRFQKKAIEDELHKHLQARYKLTSSQIAELIEMVNGIKALIDASNYSDKEVDEFWKGAGFAMNNGAKKDTVVLPIETWALAASAKQMA